MTNPDLTEIIAILDRSGSMSAVKTDTEGAFDNYVADQRKVPGEAKLSLVQFDTKIETVYATRPLAKVPPLELKPRGLTALYDAIGFTVVDFGEQFARMGEDARPGKVIVVILTDGEENSSQEWTAARLKPLIEEQTTKYGWTFLYLGANQDAVFEGGKIGINAQNSLTYDVGSMDVTVAAASAATTATRSGTFHGFSDEDRANASGLVPKIGDGEQLTTEERKKRVGWKPRSSRSA